MMEGWWCVIGGNRLVVWVFGGELVELGYDGDFIFDSGLELSG